MAFERREHRLALEVLYAIDVGRMPVDETLAQARAGVGVFARGDEAAAEDRWEPQYPAVDLRSDAPRPTDWSAVEKLVRGTLAHKEELELQLGPLLQHWTLERLPELDRLILVMAAWELRYREQTETRFIINHAVELAQRLSGQKSGRFVNGVLDAFAKTPPRVPG